MYISTGQGTRVMAKRLREERSGGGRGGDKSKSKRKERKLTVAPEVIVDALPPSSSSLPSIPLTPPPAPIVCTSSSSSSDEGIEEVVGDVSNSNDIVDIMRTKRWFGTSHVMYLIEFIQNELLRDVSGVMSIDSNFLSLYLSTPGIKSLIKNKKPDQERSTIERRRNSIYSYFSRDDYDRQGNTIKNAKPPRSIVVMPLHDQYHWSLLIYFTDLREFYHFDSLISCDHTGAHYLAENHHCSHYHENYVANVLARLVADEIIEENNGITLTSITTPAQLHDYECGQYVALYWWVFCRRLQEENVPKTRAYYVNAQLRSIPVIVHDGIGFRDRLQEAVFTLCGDAKRKIFVKNLIDTILRKRAYQ